MQLYINFIKILMKNCIYQTILTILAMVNYNNNNHKNKSQQLMNLIPNLFQTKYKNHHLFKF